MYRLWKDFTLNTGDKRLQKFLSHSRFVPVYTMLHIFILPTETVNHLRDMLYRSVHTFPLSAKRLTKLSVPNHRSLVRPSSSSSFPISAVIRRRSFDHALPFQRTLITTTNTMDNTNNSLDDNILHDGPSPLESTATGLFPTTNATTTTITSTNTNDESVVSSSSSSSSSYTISSKKPAKQRTVSRTAAASLNSSILPTPLVPFPPYRTATTGDLVSVAPMMEWTTIQYRYLVRLLSKRIRLYTEMVVANTLIYSKYRHYYLYYDPIEHPIAIQLGGNEPSSLAQCAVLAEEAGYDEINLNCGCPSNRVSVKGAFGASLMFQPELVRDCVQAMRQALKKPTTIITVKCRLGADKMDTYEEFRNFIRIVADGGCQHFIIHARKCILKGLDPHANRTIPPLRYTWVQKIALEFPHLRFSINGGFTTWEQTEQLLSLRRTNDKYNTNTIDKTYNPYPIKVLTRRQKAAEEKKKKNETEETSGNTVPKITGNDDDSCTACNDIPDTTTNGSLEADLSAFTSSGSRKNSISSTTSSQVSDSSTGIKDEATYDKIFTKFQKLKLENDRISSLTSRFPPEQFLDASEVTHIPPNVSLYGNEESVIDSVMIGRSAYNNLWMLADTDRRIFGVPNPGYSRREVIEKYIEYIETMQSKIPPEDANFSMFRPFEYVKPLFGLFANENGTRAFRNSIAVAMCEHRRTPVDAIRGAMKCIPDSVLDERPPV